MLIDIHLEAKSLLLENTGVTIEWPDGHESYFESEWLWERRFPKTAQQQTDNSTCIKPKPVLWNSVMNSELHKIEFENVVDTDESLHAFLSHLSTHGIVVLKNAPILQNQLFKIAEKVGGHVRKTHYGEIFTVKTKDDPSNLAYTIHDVPLHVDLAYYRYQPGVQFLHCLEQCDEEKGGVSWLTDGYSIAAQLKEENPQAFHTLSTVKFTFRDIGKDEYGQFEKILERTIIGLDDFGNFDHIAYNNFTRSSFFNIPLPLVQRTYEAYYAWVADKRNLVEYRMAPGDILVFDNKRVLHGRSKFDPKKSSRWLEGCYIDWDEIYSTLRCLRRRLGIVSDDKNAWYV